MTEQSYTLLMQLGPAQGETVEVSGDEFILGRDTASDWAIEDIEVSRRHARLILDKGSYSIEDLGSTNGTFVNGQRIRSLLPLLPGATIRLGENVLIFYDAKSEEEESATRTMDVETGADSPAEEDPPPEEPQAEEEPAEAKGEPVEEVEAEEAEEEAELVEPFVEEEEQSAPSPKRKAREGSGVDFSESVSILGAEISLGILAIVAIAVLAVVAFLWYIDANFLWCDVFGNLIPACR